MQRWECPLSQRFYNTKQIVWVARIMRINEIIQGRWDKVKVVEETEIWSEKCENWTNNRARLKYEN